MNICDLPSVSHKELAPPHDKKRKSSLYSFDRLASIWASGNDVEESLWWVSYACQLPKRHYNALDNNNNSEAMKDDSENGVFKKIGEKTADELDNASEVAASKLLGEVGSIIKYIVLFFLI